MTTYRIPYNSAAKERAEKEAAKAKRARKFVYDPVLFDTLESLPLKKGDVVVKIQPHGTPPNGTMGFCYVGHPETGHFIGMVRVASLKPRRKS